MSRDSIFYLNAKILVFLPLATPDPTYLHKNRPSPPILLSVFALFPLTPILSYYSKTLLLPHLLQIHLQRINNLLPPIPPNDAHAQERNNTAKNQRDDTLGFETRGKRAGGEVFA